MFKIEKIEWYNDLSIGLPEIDNQHKELFSRLNDLIEAVQAGGGDRAVNEMLEFLTDYVYYHFNTEEESMKELAYPGLEAHRDQHRVFVKSLRGLKAKYSAFGVTPSLVELMQSHICGWIVTHVKKSDKQFGLFLAGQG